MKKILLILLIILMSVSLTYGTVVKTTNLELSKPAAEDLTVDWFNTMNDNLDLIDAAFDDVLEFDDGERIEDRAGAMWTGNTETFITLTYQDADNTIDAIVPVKDEDNMASDSATFLCTQQSIKAYADTLHALQYLKTEVDTQGEVETIWGITLATDTELGNLTYSDVGAIQDTNDVITEAKLKCVDSPTDEDIFTYEATTGDFEWHTKAELGIGVATSIADDLILKADFADEDWGDMSVSTNVVTIDADAVTYAKIQNVSATDKVLGRSSAGAGIIEEITCTSAGRALIDDADASTQRATLGLVIGTNVLAEQTIGIANDNLVEIDHASVVDNDIPKFTANGLEGRSYSETRNDLSIETAYADSFATGGAGTSGDPWTGDCIQAAIDSITTGIVYLNAGYYHPTHDTPIDLKSGITLMGVPGQSVIDAVGFTGSNKPIQAVGTAEGSIAATVNIAKGDKIITMGDTSSLTAGDYIRISSDEEWLAGYDVGEIQRIKTITSGTVITLYNPVWDDYTTANNGRIYELNLVSDIIIDGITIQRGDVNASYAIHFQLGKHCIIRNCQIYGSTYAGILWDEMLYGTIESNYIKDSFYVGTDTSYGIGIMNTCQYNVIFNNKIEIARHCIAVHSNPTGGYPRFNLISSNILIGGAESTQSIADCHPTAEHIIYKNNIFIGEGLRTGMNLIAPYQQVIDNTFINCETGVLVWANIPQYSSITGNHFYEGTSAIYFSNSEASTTYYMTIADNIIHGTTYGIEFVLHDASPTTFAEIYIENNIFNVDTNWMRDPASNVTLDNCLIYGNETFAKPSTVTAITNSKAFKADAVELGGDTNYIKVALGGVMTLEGTANIEGVTATEFGYVDGVTSDIQTQFSNKQPLEATLTDIADGTIVENLVNTNNPWADNEVSDTLTSSSCTGLAATATALATGRNIGGISFDGTANIIPRDSTHDHALGSDHQYSGIFDSAPVGETVVFGDLLYYDWTAVEWKKAKADVIGTTPAQRIALEGKTDGQTCLMLVQGYIRDDSAFDFGAARVYLNDDTAGTCDDTAPAESGDQIQIVGIGITADILYFNPSIDVGEI